MTVDKVIAKIIWLTFLAHPVVASVDEGLGGYQERKPGVLYESRAY